MLFSRQIHALNEAQARNRKAGRREWKVIRDCHDGAICWLVCKA